MSEIGLVTDEASEIPQDWAKENDIEVVEGYKEWPGVDFEKLPGSNTFQKIREAERRGMKTFVKTALANLPGFRAAFQRQIQKFKKVLCLTASRRLSGSFNSAIQAKKFMPDESKIHVFDTLSGSAGEGLFVLKAKELKEKGERLDGVLEKLKGMISKVEFMAFFADPKWVVASGRVPRVVGGWIRKMKRWGFQPFITIKHGVAIPGGAIRAKDEVSAILRKAKKAIEKKKRLRAFIAHADCASKANSLKKGLENLGFEVPMVALASPIVAGHAGPDSIICAWAEM